MPGSANAGWQWNKRKLREYGYPPDLQLLAVETVLKQAEAIASELATG